MAIIEIIYILTAVIAVSACIPQLKKLIMVKSADGFSISSWAIWALAQSAGLAYVMSINNLLMTIVNTGWMLFYCSMVLLILYYRYRFVPQPVPVQATDPVSPRGSPSQID